MLSNKLTFSLTCLVVLFALAFVATPVTEAQTAVVIAEDTGADDASTRAAFNVMFTFPSDATITDDATGIVSLDTLNEDGNPVGTQTDISAVFNSGTAANRTVTPMPASQNQIFKGTLDLATLHGSIGADALTDGAVSFQITVIGNAFGTGNARSIVSFPIPPEVVGNTVEITAATGTADANTDGIEYTVTFTFNEATATALLVGDVTVEPSFVDSLVKQSNIVAPASAAAAYTLAVHVPEDLMVTIGLSETYIAAADVTSVSFENGMVVVDDDMDDDTASDGSGTFADDTVTLTGSILANDFIVIPAAQLPNLQAFFNVGGTISLVTTATGAVAKDVVISEIMWGLDKAQTVVANQANQQFIELYNTNGDKPIDLTGAMLKFDRSSVVPAAGAGEVLLDQVSNVYLGGWVVGDGQELGQSGSLGTTTTTFTPTDLVSMYRNIDYVKVEKAPAVADEAPTAAERTAQLKDFPDGKVKGSWKASTNLHMTNIVATPGAKHVVAVKVLTATSVPYSPVIINEIGNFGEKNANNWIELKAVAAVNLKNYELAVIVGGNEDTLVQFPNDKGDYNLTAGQLLLIVNKDPLDTMLARGKKFGDKNGTTPEVEQIKRGVNLDDSGSMFYDAEGGLDNLPASGKFLLVIRSEPKNNHEKIIDLVGTDFHSDTSAAYRTNLFPLQATGAGDGNVIDGDAGNTEAFDAGEVYVRKDAAGGTGEKDWGVQGYTGIGYDREAQTTAAYGGTPGYPNDTLKENGFATKDTVTISEIMVNSAEGRQPQWIELRNMSANGVNLDAWKLRIENEGEVDSRRDVTIDLPNGYRIPPNQTILIATRRAVATDELTDSRVIRLWDDANGARAALEVENPRFTMLSMEGFTLKLFEKDQKETDTPVDMVTISKDQLTEDIIGTNRERVSLVRAYIMGAKGDFFSARNSEQIIRIPNETYYGTSSDIGTPGWYTGTALPVSLSSFRPARDKATGAVVIRWITESELNNAGFNILRSETKNGEFKVVNTKGIIPGHGTTSEKHVYTWTDTSAKPNVVYYYQIEDVSLDGNRTTLRTTHLRGNVNAAGKLTMTWGDLKTQN